MTTQDNELKVSRADDNPTNGMTVLGEYLNTVYVRLPATISKVIEFGCECDYCKAHPDLEPRWDVLCVPVSDKLVNHTWTIHMPVIADFVLAVNRVKKGKR